MSSDVCVGVVIDWQQHSGRLVNTHVLTVCVCVCVYVCVVCINMYVCMCGCVCVCVICDVCL